MYHALSALADVYVDTPFDYSQVNRAWVDNPAMGPALAQRIACLAAASRQAGGFGKVIIVAHSMGGLVARFAASQTVGGQPVSHDIGLVVTIGTPNLGSGWANIAGPMAFGICHPDTLIEYQFTVSNRSLCAYLDSLNGLRDRSQEIDKLPKMPSSIPVLAIAGDETISVSLFHLTLRKDTKSDIVVSEKSALSEQALPDEGGGQVVISCSAMLFASLSTPCWHKALPNNPAAERATTNAIMRYLTAIRLSPYVGHWYTHSGGLTINADGSGEMSYRNYDTCPFGDTSGFFMCTISEQIKITVTNARAFATVTSSNASYSDANFNTQQGPSGIPNGTVYPIRKQGIDMIIIDTSNTPNAVGPITYCNDHPTTHVDCGA